MVYFLSGSGVFISIRPGLSLTSPYAQVSIIVYLVRQPPTLPHVMSSAVCVRVKSLLHQLKCPQCDDSPCPDGPEAAKRSVGCLSGAKVGMLWCKIQSKPRQGRDGTLECRNIAQITQIPVDKVTDMFIGVL